MRKGKLIGKIFGIALVFVMVGAMLGGLPSIAKAADMFNIGDNVEVYNTGGSGLLVRDAPCGDVIGGKFDGDSGVVLDGPVYCSNYNRWLVRWSDGLEGWSAEDWLEKVTPCPHSCWDRSALSGDELAALVRNHFSLGGDPQTGERIMECPR